MNHIPFTLLAYFFNATSVTIDKFMLTKHIPNPLIYIFYFSAFSALALVLLPFTHVPSLEVFLIASTSTILWTTGAYFMFKGLQLGHVSRVVPVIGTLIPMLLLIEALISQTISGAQIIAVFFLTFGLISLTIMDWKGSITKNEVIFIILSALLFAVSYIVLRQAYIRDDFLTVLVWSRFVIMPVSIIILLIPALKKIVFSSNNDKPAFRLISKPGLLFILGGAAGGSSELLLTFSISLATPALVNSLQGSQYAFLFLFSIFLTKRFPQVFKERFTSLTVITKIIGIGFIAGGLFLLAR